MPLSDTACRRAQPREKPYKMSDEKGLHLLVQPNGSKLWRLAYRFGGKQKTLAIGVYPEVSLVRAREVRQVARDQVALGRDPVVERRQKVADRFTFKAVATEYHDLWKVGKKPAFVSRIWARLERDAFPYIGHKHLNDIVPMDIIDLVRKVEQRGAMDVSKRLKQKCSEVFQYGIAIELCTSDPTASIRKALKPKPRVQHMARLPISELPGLLHRIDRYRGVLLTKLALELTLLTWVRTGEMLMARRGEFENLDGSRPIWRIPAARMKMHREHIVPLSKQAVATVKRMMALHPHDLLLPDRRDPSRPVNKNVMLAALHKMGYRGRQTVHGFRGIASTWANEREYQRDWIEMQLAHREEDEVRAAYNAAQYMTQRTKMMQDWGDFVEAQRKVSEFDMLL